jgi:hypothetical protein
MQTSLGQAANGEGRKLLTFTLGEYGIFYKNNRGHHQYFESAENGN